MQKETIDVAAVAAELGRLRVSDGYSVPDLAKRLAALDPEVCEYKKGEVMLRERERATRIGVILEGAVHIRYSGMEGKSVLLHMYVAGSFVGLSSVVMEQPTRRISPVCFTPCRMLWLSVPKVLAWRRDPSSARFFAEMNRQMFAVLSELMNRCAILGQPRLEDRVMTYLRQRCAEEGTKTVVVPGTEADFADYLGVHVVALSRALSRMKAAGLIAYRRNVLTLRM